MVVSGDPSLLDQIDTVIQAIAAKLSDRSNTGSDLGALIATAVTNEATTNAVVDTMAAQVVTSDAVADTMTTNLATVQTLLDALNAQTGTGIGITADVEPVATAATLHEWIAAAIITETP